MKTSSLPGALSRATLGATSRRKTPARLNQTLYLVAGCDMSHVADQQLNYFVMTPFSGQEYTGQSVVYRKGIVNWTGWRILRTRGTAGGIVLDIFLANGYTKKTYDIRPTTKSYADAYNAGREKFAAVRAVSVEAYRGVDLVDVDEGHGEQRFDDGRVSGE